MSLSRRAFLGQAAAAALALPARAAPSPARRFRTVNRHGRWLFLAPENQPFWMLGVFNVDLSDSSFAPGLSSRSLALAKYGSEAVWARQACTRLHGWGFNCLAEYASDYALPLPLYGRPGNPARLPFMGMIRPSAFSLTNRWGFAHAPVRDIVAAADPAVYTGWRGAAPDVFDPNFALYASNEARDLAQRFGASSDLIGVGTDDTDDLFGFGPGPDIPAARIHPHLGWLTLVGNFEPHLYSKFALQAWLRQRYPTIDDLNRAWGARYSGFNSDGGWPHGRGLLDESGRNPWVGADPYRLGGITPALRADLDLFLESYARAYFTAVTAAVHASFPDVLVFGPATLNAWNGLTRSQILRAAGASLDVLQAAIGSSRTLDLTVAAAGDLPIVTWTGMAANPDSDLYAFPNPSPGSPIYATQSARGDAYANALLADFDRATASGGHPIAGTKFWSYADSWAEKMNWGLVSLRDNAYDGREAVRAPGRDRWGFATGGEARDFGDSLGAIQAANAAVAQRLHNFAAASG